MLAVLVPGRLVNVEPHQVDENKFLFPLYAPETVNHVAVFLTGQMPLADGIGASIYFCWPNPEPSWHYLGFICNEKPSALFRIAKLRPQGDAVAHPFGEMPAFAAGDEVAQIGITLEPLGVLAEQTPAAHTAAQSASDFATFINYAVENLVNFVGSFVVSGDEAMQRAAYGEDGWFPIGCINKWHETFLSKLQHDPTFWR